MNSVLFIGRLTRDPEFRYATESGKPVINFTLAVNREYEKNKADFFRVITFGKNAENAQKYLSKGSLVAVSGKLKNNHYETTSGEKRYGENIIADRVEYLSSKKVSAPEANQSGFAPVEDDDNIPF